MLRLCRRSDGDYGVVSKSGMPIVLPQSIFPFPAIFSNSATPISSADEFRDARIPPLSYREARS